jgi:hypothetical protein
MNTSAHVAQSNYSPIDGVNRHDYGGVQKNRKQASTGGGRAWSEDEVCENVLLCKRNANPVLRRFIFSKLVSRKCLISISLLT